MAPVGYARISSMGGNKRVTRGMPRIGVGQI